MNGRGRVAVAGGGGPAGGAGARPEGIPGLTLTRADFEAARRHVSPHVYRTPMLTSRSLNEASGLDVRLKAELFQRGGSYKVRGPLNKIAKLSDEERARGVICSSAGNHAQGVAIAARHYGVRAVVVMAENATRSKIAATKGYGARVVLHGDIWDEANEKAIELVKEEGFTYIHPFDDPDLIAGQGTVGLEIMEQFPEAGVVVVPIGGGGLISGIAMAVKSVKPGIRVIGVESSGAPAMQRSVEAGGCVTLDEMGLHHRRAEGDEGGGPHLLGGLPLRRRDRDAAGRTDLRRGALADDQGEAGDRGRGRVAGGGVAGGVGGRASRDEDGLRAERRESGCGATARVVLELAVRGRNPPGAARRGGIHEPG